jgi:hypothetical protein
VSATSDGSVYASGYIYGNGYDFGNGVTATGIDIGNNCIILVKYNNSGTAQWAKSLKGESMDSSFTGVSATSDGSVYALGYIKGTGTYDFGNSVTATGTFNSINPILIKYQ